jgi:hypothetical protein
VRILIESIPHALQRYPTVGDWTRGADTLYIKVSELPDEREMILVGLHELIEAVLCEHSGVLEESVDDFDTHFDGEGEPGDDPAAPYHRQHRLATAIERVLAEQLLIDWDEYERHIEELG